MDNPMVLLIGGAVVVVVLLAFVLRSPNKQSATDELDPYEIASLVKITVEGRVPEREAPGQTERSQAPPGPPDFRIAYNDAQGRRTEREITVTSITRSRSGLLYGLTRLDAWCHLARDRRTFVIQQIERIGDPGQSFGETPPSIAMERFAAARPGLVQTNRATDWAVPLPGKQTPRKSVAKPFDVLLRLVGEQGEFRMTVRELAIEPLQGAIIGVRGRNHVTRGTGLIGLAAIRMMADAESGEVVTADTAQAWLQEKLPPTTAEGSMK